MLSDRRLAQARKFTWLDGDLEVVEEDEVAVEEHYPGGKGHDQKKHGGDVFHGTSKENVEGILDKGIISNVKGQPVFVTTSLSNAQFYGRTAAEQEGSKRYAVVVARVPNLKFHQADNFTAKLINKKYIKSIRYYELGTHKDKLIRTTKISEAITDETVVYIVLTPKHVLMEATTKVKSHTRTSKTGKVSTVRQHDREITKAAADMKIIGAKGEEEHLLRKWLSEHDPKVLKAVPFVAIMNQKDFTRAWAKTGGAISEANNIAAFYDEKKSFIVLNRNSRGLQDVLSHELGHAAYYHSPLLDKEWNKVYIKDKKFDRHTWYSKQDVVEGFAESYMAYMVTNGKTSSKSEHEFKKTFRQVRKIIKSVNPKRNMWDDRVGEFKK